MKLRFGLPILAALALFGCTLPNMPVRSSSTASPGTGSTATSSTSTLSVTVDQQTNTGLLVTPNGRIPIEATTADGTTVVCADPISVRPISTGSNAGGAQQSAAILGTTSDGRPALWIYSGNKIFAPENETTGKATPYLEESGDKSGDFGRGLGWSYTPTGMKHHLIAGYAENKTGVKIGPYTIAPGTTVGVYWRIHVREWDRFDHRDHGSRFRYVLGPAHVIGTLSGPSPSLGSHDKRHWDHGYGDHHGRYTRLNLLRLFLFQTYSAYLTWVDKSKPILYDKSTKTYTVAGKDQNGNLADAAISPAGVISITQEQTTAGSLVPTAISYSTSAGVSGGALPVTVTIKNDGTTAVNTTFPVDFYVATSTTFSPSSDPSAGSMTVSQSIQGGSSVNISDSLTLPTLPSSDFGSNEGIATHLYAVVDPNNVSGASGSPSNTSTVSESAAMVMFDSAAASSYSVKIETFAPTGTSTGSANPGVAIYEASGNSLVLVSGTTSSSFLAPSYYNGFTATGLTPGTTYYVVVHSASGAAGVGPYGLELLPDPTGMTVPTLSNLTSEPSTANDSPTITLTGSAPPSTLSTIPSTTAVDLKVGSAVNWYLSSGTDTDWFKFTLP